MDDGVASSSAQKPSPEPPTQNDNRRYRPPDAHSTYTAKHLDWIENWDHRTNGSKHHPQLGHNQSMHLDLPISAISSWKCVHADSAASLCTPLTWVTSLIRRSLDEGALQFEWIETCQSTSLSSLKTMDNAPTRPTTDRSPSHPAYASWWKVRLKRTALLCHLQQPDHSKTVWVSPKHSTVPPCADRLAYLHNLQSATNKERHNLACFLGIAAAFDTISHILHLLTSSSYYERKCSSIPIFDSSSPLSNQAHNEFIQFDAEGRYSIRGAPCLLSALCINRGDYCYARNQPEPMHI
jgi:hypothetical protein